MISIKVLIDADGCPVISAAVDMCREFAIPCLILCDTAHQFASEYAQVLTFDKGSDSVDYALVARAEPGDVVITQDYGLASMCLARKAKVLHQDGWEYHKDNIDALLLFRHESRKNRAAGGRIKGQSKRTPAQNRAFSEAFRQLLQHTVQG